MEPQERSPGLRLVLEVGAAGHDSELDGDEGKIKDDSFFPRDTLSPEQNAADSRLSICGL